MESLRIILAAGACVVVGALFGPTFATATVDKMRDVIVKNDASNAIPVNVAGTPMVAEAGTPVVFRGELSVSPNITIGSSQPYAVPAGKRLRIDHVTFHDGDRVAKVEHLRLLTRLDGKTVEQPILVHSQGTEGDAASQPIRAYADDPGSAVRFHVRFDQVLSTTATHILYATFTGVLVDA